MGRPIIAITQGDPAGIGPEIIIKALQNDEVYEWCNPIVVGCKEVFEKYISLFGYEDKLKINICEDVDDGKFEKGIMDLIPIKDFGEFEIGKAQVNAGLSAYECIKKTTELALSKKVLAVATTPINKEAIRNAGINCIGHTEMFGELTGTEDPLTMFQVKSLRVFFLSRHVSLSESIDMVKQDRISDYSKRCLDAMKMLGIKDGVLAIAGLNPHNGEHGLFGTEEMYEIEPAVREMQTKKLRVAGPVPADSVFYQAMQGKYDAVLSLNHDQGHIATKTVDFERTIALTIGLPFLRTSVDHGTAFDIAGVGIANEISMLEAIRLAALYGPKYNS